MPYRLELANTGRAGCKGSICQEQKAKITKGELRFGSQFEIGGHVAWSWKHWGCVTPKQLANLWKEIEGDYEYLDGYEELPPDLQDKIRVALEQGHVSDSDWNGDPEYNRPGMNGMKARTPKKKAVKEEDAEGSPSKSGAKKLTKRPDGVENSTNTPTSKKRSRSKKHAETVDQDQDQEPSRKKTKNRIKEEPDDSGEEHVPPAKKAKAKKSVVKEEGSDEDDYKELAPKKGKTSKKVKEEVDYNDEVAPKKRKGRAKKVAQDAAVGNGDDAWDAEEDVATKLAQKAKKQKGKPLAKIGTPNIRRRTRSNPGFEDTPDGTNATGPSVEKSAKAKRGRKKTNAGPSDLSNGKT